MRLMEERNGSNVPAVGVLMHLIQPAPRAASLADFFALEVQLS